VNKKVLIVDDEEEIAAFMSNFLKRLNVDSVICASGEEAIEVYKKQKFDCVLLDIHLGGISGVEVLKILKNFDPDIKVIIVTGSISGDNKDTVIHLGALDYLQKPIELNDLKDKVLKYI
jgi:DNA-binding NtrC family response regulator